MLKIQNQDNCDNNPTQETVRLQAYLFRSAYSVHERKWLP